MSARPIPCGSVTSASRPTFGTIPRATMYVTAGTRKLGDRAIDVGGPDIAHPERLGHAIGQRHDAADALALGVKDDIALVSSWKSASLPTDYRPIGGEGSVHVACHEFVADELIGGHRVAPFRWRT